MTSYSYVGNFGFQELVGRTYSDPWLARAEILRATPPAHPLRKKRARAADDHTARGVTSLSMNLDNQKPWKEVIGQVFPAANDSQIFELIQRKSVVPASEKQGVKVSVSSSRS